MRYDQKPGFTWGRAIIELLIVAAYDRIRPKLERVIGQLDAELERLQ